MEILIPIGTVITLLGLATLMWCIYRVAKARNSSLEDEQLRSMLQAITPINLAALFLSVLGLIIVIVGIALT
jgi:hypothetical protein